MNEVQKKVIELLDGKGYIVNINDGGDVKIIELIFGFNISIQSDGNVFYKMKNKYQSHGLILAISDISKSIDNILSEGELV